MRDYREQTIPKERSDNFAYTLARVRWDVFGTLTFEGRVPRPAIAYGHAWRHFRQAAELAEQPYAQLLIALREELGEQNGRFHFHHLLGGTQTRNAITLSHRLEHSWKGQTGAISKIRPYDDSQAGVAYVTKCLSGADVYEMDKFISADQVTLSSSVYRVVRSLERIAEDTRLALAKKRTADEAAS
jgi:hypothetical protein